MKKIIIDGVEYNLTPKNQNPIMEINKKYEWGKTAEKQMTWEDAKKWCEEQGEGWRMPELFELILAYNNKISGFKFFHYWSATEDTIYSSWVQSFADGSQNNYYKSNTYYVRCIREIKFN